MVELIGIVLVCMLINAVKLVLVIYFSIGIGILGAIDYISQNKIPINKFILLILQIASTIMISLPLLNEGPVYSVFLLLLGMCMYYILYNLKNSNNVSRSILLIVTCVLINVAFFNLLDSFRFIVFAVCTLVYFGLIYIKKPCSTYS